MGERVVVEQSTASVVVLLCSLDDEARDRHVLISGNFVFNGRLNMSSAGESQVVLCGVAR